MKKGGHVGTHSFSKRSAIASGSSTSLSSYSPGEILRLGSFFGSINIYWEDNSSLYNDVVDPIEEEGYGNIIMKIHVAPQDSGGQIIMVGLGGNNGEGDGVDK